MIIQHWLDRVRCAWVPAMQIRCIDMDCTWTMCTFANGGVEVHIHGRRFLLKCRRARVCRGWNYDKRVWRPANICNLSKGRVRIDGIVINLWLLHQLQKHHFT